MIKIEQIKKIMQEGYDAFYAGKGNLCDKYRGWKIEAWDKGYEKAKHDFRKTLNNIEKGEIK